MYCYKLVDINFPQRLISIGKWAFHSCISLAAVVLADSVTKIKDEAFFNCMALSQVTLPGALTEVGNDVFKDISPALILTVAEGSGANE